MAPNFHISFKLACDASVFAAVSALLQDDDGGVEHPVAYFSKKFIPVQLNNVTVEKELLTIILALQNFSYYFLPGRTVVIYTDYKSLQFLDNFKQKNQRLLCWSFYLQDFTKIMHVKGKDNALEDCLSRPVIH